jgi:hypothetical protein
MEQKLIIGKYHNILYSKLNNPESYYIGSVEELSEERFLFVFFPLSLLQSYILRCSTDVMEEHCGGIIGLDGDISIVINKDGEIIESNEKDHSEPIFR